MRHTASLFFPTSPDTANAIAHALTPEARQNEVPKTYGTAHAGTDGVRIELHAEDAASLRAAINSYCRWVEAARKATELAR